MFESFKPYCFWLQMFSFSFNTCTHDGVNQMNWDFLIKSIKKMGYHGNISVWSDLTGNPIA